MKTKNLENLKIAVMKINFYNQQIRQNQELINKHFLEIIECFYPDELSGDKSVSLEIVDDFLTIVHDGHRLYLQHLNIEM